MKEFEIISAMSIVYAVMRRQDIADLLLEFLILRFTESPAFKRGEMLGKKLMYVGDDLKRRLNEQQTIDT